MRRSSAAHPVGKIMNPTPVTITANATVGELLRRFEEQQWDAMPVLDSEGCLCGIVSSLDLLRVLRPTPTLRMPARRSLAARSVGTIMRPGVYTLEATEPLAAALELMLETHFHVLPVVRRAANGPVLVGVVHRRDLIAALVAPSKQAPAVPTRRVATRGGRSGGLGDPEGEGADPVMSHAGSKADDRGGDAGGEPPVPAGSSPRS